MSIATKPIFSYTRENFGEIVFTGLVKDIGIVKEVISNKEGIILGIQSDLVDSIQIDDSIAVEGVCQTAIRVNSNTFWIQAVHGTLEKTTFKSLKVGSKVNLELALSLSDRLGGHLVQGHVNSIGVLSSVRNIGNNYLVSVAYGKEIEKYLIEEGSITLNGISLTIFKLNRAIKTLTVSVIPHTYANTTLKYLRVGSKINIEVDCIAKYVENLIKYEQKSNTNENLMKLIKEFDQ